MTEHTWIEKLSVGNALLDAEHKKLIDLVNSVQIAISAKNGDVLLQALNLLIDCVCIHFENEEKIAQAINLSFFEHEMEHQYVKNELLNIRDELVGRNGRWSESAAYHYSYILSEWLNEHLTKETMIIKSILQVLPYNFVPISGRRTKVRFTGSSPFYQGNGFSSKWK